MKKRILCMTLAVFMMLSVISNFTFAAVIFGGNCGKDGNNVTWSYDNKNCELILNGTGAMANYAYSDSTYAPWRKYKDNIKSVSISNGITSIGEYAFFEFSSMTSISIPDSVTYIGKDAFKLCTALTSFTAPKNITEITRHLFHDCYSLKKVTLHKKITTIHSNAFENCNELIHMDYEGSDEDFLKIKFEDKDKNGKKLLDYNPKLLIEFKGGHTHKLHDYISDGEATCFKPATESAICEFEYCTYKETRPDEDAKSPHWFGYYVYNDDEGYGKNGTETAMCMFGCETKDTREKPGTALVNSVKKFKDVKKGKWYVEFIDSAVGRGLFDGTSSNTFEPDASMTRAMFVTVLCRMSGTTVSNDEGAGFADVPKGKWFSGAVKWAFNNGIVNGVSSTKFEPNTAITREQLCAMLVRYSDFMGIAIESNTESVTFKDDLKISIYAYNAVGLCQRAGLISGMGNGKFEPKMTATRAQVAKILSLYCKYNLCVTYVPPED